MRKIKNGILLGSMLLLAGACQNAAPQLDNGTWKATLENESGVELPFYFQIYDSAGSKQLAFLNGPEHLNISEVSIEKDSVIFATPLYDTQIRAVIKGGRLEGSWIKRLPTGEQRMPFLARHGVKEGYFDEGIKDQPADYDLRGRWAVEIIREGSQDTTQALGDFSQIGNAIAGTFLTNYGDYRFLGGEIFGKTLALSSYSGSSATLFTAEFSDENTIENGMLYAGPSYVARWRAYRDKDARLPDAYTLTRLKDGENTLHFEFQDTNGNRVSPQDERYKGKVVVIQFLGSWCPNCMDETAFLSPFYERYKDQGFEVIGLAYERYAEPERAKKAVHNLMERFNVTYPVLLPGVSNKPEEVLKSLPQLENFSAFPTTIIINKKGTVSSIHTGFDGPATGKAYQEYIRSFEQKIQSLLSES